MTPDCLCPSEVDIYANGFLTGVATLLIAQVASMFVSVWLEKRAKLE